MRYARQVAVLAMLYMVSGKLGLLLAVPGFAAALWPPAGIAVAMLLIHGSRLWPGGFLGALLLNSHSYGVVAEGAFHFKALLAAIATASGASIAAIMANCMTHRFIGLPLPLDNPRRLFHFLALILTVPTIVSALIGVSTLYLAQIITPDFLLKSYGIWALGDGLGILIFVPLILLLPREANLLSWRGRPLNGMPAMVLLLVLLPIGGTVYGWHFTSQKMLEQGQREFESIASENEYALLHQLDGLDHALRGGAGFFLGSEHVSRGEWEAYVAALQIDKNYRGLQGLGWITPLASDAASRFLREMRADGAPHFTIHPPGEKDLQYVITYIEPEGPNAAALGLNIAFEKNRREAAEIARDTGQTTLTKSIVLVQDFQGTPGFLLLHPLYRLNMPVTTVEERRAAFMGWVYAPLLAENLLKKLMPRRGQSLELRIYDGPEETNDRLIFSSVDIGGNISATPRFRVHKTLSVFGQEWRMVWTSTRAYEQMETNDVPLLILVAGSLFSLLMMMFLVVMLIRRNESITWATEEQKYLIPLTIFALVALGSYTFFAQLQAREEEYIRSLVREQAEKIEQLIQYRLHDRLQALQRMGRRWEIAGRTDEALWRDDARHYVENMPGLKAVEWIDEHYYIRLVEPIKGNEKALGLFIAFDADRARELHGAGQRDRMTITSPLTVVQGYKALIAYSPLYIANRFDGFMAGVFSIDHLMQNILLDEIAHDYGLFIQTEGEEFYRNRKDETPLMEGWTVYNPLQIYDKQWMLRVVPTQEFIAQKRTYLPYILLIAGLLIGVLLAMTLRYILVARAKSQHLATSEATFRSAMEAASIGMALVGIDGRWLKVNQALCDLFGYMPDTLLTMDFQTITHPDDLNADLDLVAKTLRGDISAYQLEKRYYHKNGRIIWALLNVSLVRDAFGEPRYFISQIQDVTEQKHITEIKSEFISIVSHELRTPLTAIRGSLGLLLGTMKQDMSARVLKLVDIANKNCERLALLINDILDMDKLASGEMQFIPKPVNVAELVHQSAETNQAYADRFHVRLYVAPIPGALTIHVDADRLIQVLTNFISNAVKFSPEGGVVTLSVQERGRIVRLMVNDKGPGISEQFRSRIFNKFSQADDPENRTRGGTGLGLYISKQMVEIMHGQIGFDTVIGQGTTFWAEFTQWRKE